MRGEKNATQKDMFDAASFNNGQNSRTINNHSLMQITELHSKEWHINSVEYKIVSTMWKNGKLLMTF